MSLLDDASLNESERALIEAFERRSTNSVSPTDPGASASAEEEVDPVVPATPPGPAPESTDPSAAPSPPTQIEGSDEGGEENAPSPTATGDASTGEGEVDQSAVASGASDSTFTFAGVEYKPEELAQGVQLRNWYQSLNPQQLQSIDALLSGQYRLVPAHEAIPAAPPIATAPAQSPASSTAPAITDDDAGDWLDPRAQQEINALRSELANLQQSVQQSVTPLVQSQHDAHMQQTLNLVDAATQEFTSRYNLTPEQAQPILQSVVEAQILPGLQARHGGDVKSATLAALDMMFWTTPSFREPYVQQKTAADLAALTAQQQTDKVKQQQMTALSASGGSVPRRDPKPNNKEDRHAAMVAEIAASQNGQ